MCLWTREIMFYRWPRNWCQDVLVPKSLRRIRAADLATKGSQSREDSNLMEKNMHWWCFFFFFQTLDRNIFINHKYLEKLYHGTCVMFMFFSSTMNNINLPTVHTVLSMVSYRYHLPQSWRSVHAVCWAPPAAPSCGSVPSHRASWALPSFCPHGGS